ISYANCGLPYYIGDTIKERDKLFVQTAASFSKRFNIDVRVNTLVNSIDPDSKTVVATDLINNTRYELSYDKLVLSPGAEPLRPPLPGANLEGIFTLRNVPDTDAIKTFASSPGVKKAVVVGAGFIGLEMAENFHQLGLEVSIVEMGGQVMAPADFPIAAMVQAHLTAKHISIHLNTAVTSFSRNNERLSVVLSNGEVLDADIVLLSIGVRPETRLAAEAGLSIGLAKGIQVNEYLQTSNPDIYAVGDAIEFLHPLTGQPALTFLAGPANKQGRICANNMVRGNREKYGGSIGTAIVKVFDMTVGVTGASAKLLQRAGIPHIVSTTHSGSHAGYYPGARNMSIELMFSPGDGRILGAQVAGYEGVDKRLDILSAFIQMGKTVYDLAAFEQAYAPPYSSAKDPVNMAGFVAENILDGQLKIFYWDELKAIQEGDVLVDVRRTDEFEAGHIHGAINIPVDELRERMGELDPNQTIYIYCEAGLRGYLAQRILRQHGFNNVLNLSGGYQLWRTCEAAIKG
ncbi:MAG: FAD-dependent oxidoreductase, partial [Bacteroidota bacterium]|nr:FAD-dependent oxidoreductase [Bacteroidota bacterium]